LQQAMYIGQWTKAGGAVKFDQENTGHGFKTVRYLEPAMSSMATSCKMPKR
jgi:branched-chain amino acid transport system substrate-binding protein